MNGQSLPIIEGAHGITLFSAWFVVLREDWDFMQDVLSHRTPPTRRAFEVVLTLNHEGVHFIQGITTAAAYSYSLNLLALCATIQGAARRGELTSERLRTFRSTYRSYGQFLSNKKRGVSTLDLLEGVAAIEAYRATSVDVTADGLLDHLDTFFPDKTSRYRLLPEVVGRKLGGAAMLNLASRVAYLALNSDDPPTWFWSILDALSESPSVAARIASTTELARLFAFDLDRFILALHRKRNLPAKHPLLEPYLDYLVQLGTDEEICELASTPGSYLRSQAGPADAKLLPPLMLTSGGRGRPMGLAAEWSQDQLFWYLDTAALVGSCELLLCDDRPYQCCPHLECPIHETALCHQWFAVPLRIPWAQCGFPKRLRVQFGTTATELIKIRDLAMASE